MIEHPDLREAVLRQNHIGVQPPNMMMIAAKHWAFLSPNVTLESVSNITMDKCGPIQPINSQRVSAT